MNDNNISSLASKFKSIVDGLEVEDYFKSFHTTPQHDGSPHIEMKEGKFHFVVTERGAELERIKNLNSDEVLYLLFDGITQHIATTYELNNRKEGIDGRSVWFPYQEMLMSNLKPEWGQRLKEDHQRVLKNHPFCNNAQQGALADAEKRRG